MILTEDEGDNDNEENKCEEGNYFTLCRESGETAVTCRPEECNNGSRSLTMTNCSDGVVEYLGIAELTVMVMNCCRGCMLIIHF